MKQLFTTILFLLLCWHNNVAAQCSTPGQTPGTAFPVCGTSVFHQSSVPLCTNKDPLFVPCSDGASYADKNPFYYRFTCYVSGTLGFLITPLAANEDYDWQLYDITGKDPAAIFSDNSTVVIGNWAGTYGPTGASSTGVDTTQCGSIPELNLNTFSKMPDLIEGHTYLLMISHWTDGQSGYDLSFGGGTAVITDPQMPHMLNAVSGCDGKSLTVRLNKKIRCNSLTSTGSEFSVFPAATTVVSATTTTCSPGFDFDELTLSFATPLPSNIYELIINNGSDGNTLTDLCGNNITQGEKISFEYLIPQPILADSVRKPACAPDSILLFYPKKIQCSSISPDGGDFSISGPTTVNVIGASGKCVNDLTDYVLIKFAEPIYTKGTYSLSIEPGIDGSPVFDLCGQPIQPQTLSFITADTVNANFTYVNDMGCQRDTLHFTHNGAHDVNKWNWAFNNGPNIGSQNHTLIWPAKSDNIAQLIVGNGTCKDTALQSIKLDNAVMADFSIPSIICPEDALVIKNNSEGLIDSWKWTYDIAGSSTMKDPPAFLMPNINKEAYYTIKLVASNNGIGCSDSARHTLTVLDHCVINVPTGFTPNNDGLNDYFRPHNAIKADNYQFRVYNRWGQLVFQSRNWQERWDGRFKGELQASGVFVWMVSYTHSETQKAVFKKGTVMLIR